LPEILDFVAGAGFNGLRLPFSVQLVEELDTARPTNLGAGNEALAGLTAGAQVDAVVAAAAARGILIMLDCHHMEAKPSAIPELWYTEEYGEARVTAAWQALARRYRTAWNVFAADLNNEPHGRASWGDGVAATDWRAGAERLGAAVLAANPRLLCFVEGTAGNAVPIQSPEPCFWGGGLCSAVASPVTLPVPRRLVLSPHVYGPGVFMQPYFSDPAFPANMADIWTRQWAHPVLCGCEGGGGRPAEAVPAIVPGEWGGRFEAGSLERVWALAFAQWQRETGLTDSFFWCLNPNSGDTGGLLSDDWRAPQAWKLALLAAINPAPSRFGPDGALVDPGGGAAGDGG
jgi:endoglucanase